MTELALRTTPGGVVGDTHGGYKIIGIKDAATGQYVWEPVSVEGFKSRPDAQFTNVVPSLPTVPLILGTTPGGSNIVTTGTTYPEFTPSVDMELISMDVRINSTAGQNAARDLWVYVGNTVVARTVMTNIAAGSNQVLNFTFAAPAGGFDLTAGTTYQIRMNAPSTFFNFIVGADTLPELGFSNGSPADPSIRFNGEVLGSGDDYLVSFSSDGINEYYAGVSQVDPTKTVSGTAPVPAQWQPVAGTVAGVTGVILGSYATTGAFPAAATNTDNYAILDVNEVGTGTASSPQFYTGLYRSSGLSWNRVVLGASIEGYTRVVTGQEVGPVFNWIAGSPALFTAMDQYGGMLTATFTQGLNVFTGTWINAKDAGTSFLLTPVSAPGFTEVQNTESQCNITWEGTTFSARFNPDGAAPTAVSFWAGNGKFATGFVTVTYKYEYLEH